MNQSDMALIRVVSLQGVERNCLLKRRQEMSGHFEGSGSLAKPHLELHSVHIDAAGLGIIKPRKASLKAIESPLLLKDRELACHSNVLAMLKCTPFEYARAQKCHRVLKKQFLQL